ncbi:hypothetical protein ACQ4PT_042446 [Festuca glaucescens]
MGSPPLHGRLQLPLGHVGLGRADDEAFFEAVGAFGSTELVAPSALPLATVEGVARQLQRLELDGGGRSTFLGKLLLQPGQAILGTPPVAAAELPVPAVEPTTAPPARRSARIGALGLGSLTVEQCAHALLAKQLEFIDKVTEHSPRVRGRFVACFKSPLGRKAVTKLARIVGIGSQATIALPDEDLQACLGMELHGANRSSLSCVNSSHIVLIPKNDNPASLADYRPISLMHGFAKLFMKVLAVRLAKRIPELIGEGQSAFIRGRSIQDNFLYVQQLTCRILKKKLGFIERTKARDAKMNIGYHLQNCDEQSQVINLTGNASPITGGKRLQKQPADASILQSNQTTKSRTPPAHQHNNGNHLLGIASPSSISSLGTLQSWSTSLLECLTPSPVTMPVAEITAGQEEDQARGGDRTLVTKKPIDRLIDAMRSSSPAALRSSANSIWSVLSINDIVTRGKVGTILDCKSSRQQQQGEPNAVNKMKRVFNNTATHSSRYYRENANDALLEEIKSINSTLIDTVISMSGDCLTDGISSYYGGAMIKLSYSAVSISPIVKSLFATSEMSLVLPAKLFVPPDYPRSSPVLINDGGDEVLRKNSSAITISVDVAFRHALADLSEPRSIKETARAWDACVRKAVTEFAHRHGGGTVSSMLGRWERCAAT